MAGEPRDAIRAELEVHAENTRWSGVAVDCELAFGPTVAAVVAAAEHHAADLVVAGAPGPRHLEHLLLGSTAEEVLASAPCPVVTGRPTSA